LKNNLTRDFFRGFFYTIITIYPTIMKTIIKNEV